MPRTEAPLPPQARHWRQVLLALALVFGLVNLWALAYAPRALDPHRAGSWCVTLAANDSQGWQQVKDMASCSPLAVAGIRIGDQVRFPYFSDQGSDSRPLDTQETVRLEVRPADPATQAFSVALHPAPQPQFRTGRAWVSYLTGWSARFVALFLMVLVVIRRPQDIALRGLTLALLADSMYSWYFLPGGAFHDVVTLELIVTTDLTIGLSLLWFALHYPEENSLWRHPTARLLFAGNVVAMIAYAGIRIGISRGQVASDGSPLWQWIFDSQWGGAMPLCQASLFGTLSYGIWRASGAMRTRLVWVTIGIFCISGMSIPMSLLEGTSAWPVVSAWQYVIGDVGALLGAILLVWAVFRHRAFDLGVVLQRTLALSVVSTTLLTILGLGKWLTEKLLHEAGLVHSMWSDMGVTLVVVAAFAAVQAPLLAKADALVFRRWHAAAAALQDFVERAALVTDPALMQKRFVQAVDAFAGSSCSALYTTSPDGALHRVHGTLPGAPEALDVNDPLAIELRHGANRVDLTRLVDSVASGKAEWAFAMRVGGRVRGVLLLGARPDDAAYRAEELSRLEDSTRRIGLDLESLRVDELERDRQALRTKLEALQGLSTRVAMTPEGPRAGSGA